MSLKLLMILIRAEGRLRVILGRWMFLISYCRGERLLRRRGHHMLLCLILIQQVVLSIIIMLGGFLMGVLMLLLMWMVLEPSGIFRLIGLVPGM